MAAGVAAWEQELVARIMSGDDSALALAFDEYGAVVNGIAVRLVGRDHAADICQEVFLALWDQPERFDAHRGSLRTFLVVLARRRCVDHLRRQGRRAANELRAHDTTTTSADVTEVALATLEGRRVRDAVSRLTPTQRHAIELAYFQGLTFKQVAQATGASEGTAKSRIRLGLARLAEELRDARGLESV